MALFHTLGSKGASRKHPSPTFLHGTTKIPPIHFLQKLSGGHSLYSLNDFDGTVRGIGRRGTRNIVRVRLPDYIDLELGIRSRETGVILKKFRMIFLLFGFVIYGVWKSRKFQGLISLEGKVRDG